VTDEPTRRLSDDEVVALRFAAHRQLARWAHKADLSRHQHARRAALVRAVRTLQDKALAHGCELHGVPEDENADA
jgi:hypothetical protein